MSMSVAYGLKKKAKMAKGTPCAACASGQCMEHGGEVDDSHDMVGRIMAKRMAKGGEVAAPADAESNDFDVLDEEPAPESSETGASSGDEDGDDVVSRAMKSRSKKAKA